MKSDQIHGDGNASAIQRSFTRSSSGPNTVSPKDKLLHSLPVEQGHWQKSRQLAGANSLKSCAMLILVLHSTSGWNANNAGQRRLMDADGGNSVGPFALSQTRHDAKLAARSNSQLLVGRDAGSCNQIEEFSSWLQRRGAYTDSLCVSNSSIGGGKGLFLTRDVKKNEILLRVPKSACITMQNVFDDPECGNVFRTFVDENGKAGVMAAFCGYLAKKWLLEGPDGEHYGPYLSMLPWKREASKAQQHILWWSDAQIGELEGSLAFEEAIAMREGVDAACSLLKPLLSDLMMNMNQQQLEQLSTGHSVDQLIRDAVRSAFVVYFSRALRIPKPCDAEIPTSDLDENQDWLVENEGWLVPMLDFLQHHDGQQEPMVGYCQYGEEIIMLCERAQISKGSELFTCYADENEMPLHSFLVWHGFLPGSNTPIFDLAKNKDPMLFGIQA